MGDQLLLTARTSDGLTPSRNPDIRAAVDTIKHQLGQSGLEAGPTAPLTVAAGFLVQAAAGKPDTGFRVYYDENRIKPSERNWRDMLAEQFGDDGARAVIEASPELSTIVSETEALVAMYRALDDPGYQKPPDSLSSFTHRLNSVDPDMYEAYVRGTYGVRGLPVPEV